MKNNIRIFLSLFLALSLMLSSCSYKSNRSPTLSDSVLGGESYYLVNQTEKTAIFVHVPVLERNVDQCLLDFVCTKIQEICYAQCDFEIFDDKFQLTAADIHVEDVDVYAQIDYQISMNTDEMISLVFEGIVNQRSAAYPTNVFFTININPATRQCFNLHQEITLNEDFFSSFKQIAKEQNPDFAEIIEKTVDFESFRDGLTGGSYHCYYTPSELGISVPVIHALGDHIEIKMAR